MPHAEYADVKDQPAHYWSHGTWFRMPLGYHNPQGPARNIPFLSDPDRFAEVLARSPVTGYDPETGCFDADRVTSEHFGRPFSFWYPSGDYIGFDMEGPRAVYDCPAGPCDPGREDGRDQFSVFFRMIWGPGAPDHPALVSHLDYRLLLEWSERHAAGLPQPTDAIERIEKTWRGPISQTDDYDVFGDDGTVRALLSCFAPANDRWIPFANCRRWFHDRETGMLAYVVMPFTFAQRGDDPHWRSAIEMIRTKIDEWTIGDIGNDRRYRQ